jgi:hypothetical protein
MVRHLIEAGSLRFCERIQFGFEPAVKPVIDYNAVCGAMFLGPLFIHRERVVEMPLNFLGSGSKARLLIVLIEILLTLVPEI